MKILVVFVLFLLFFAGQVSNASNSVNLEGSVKRVSRVSTVPAVSRTILLVQDRQQLIQLGGAENSLRSMSFRYVSKMHVSPGLLSPRKGIDR